MRVKRIEIAKENIEVLNETIKVCEGRARSRTYTAERLLKDVMEVEKRLRNFGIPKKLWHGMKISFGCASNRFPVSYNGVPEATCVSVENIRGKWYFISAERDNACRYRTDGRIHLDCMKEEVRKEIESRILLNFCEFGGTTLF